MNEEQYYIELVSIESNNKLEAHQTQQAFDIERLEYNLVAMLKPTLSIDGNQYCFLWGPNQMEGVSGFGNSPYLAMLDFNKSWQTELGG